MNSQDINYIKSVILIMNKYHLRYSQSFFEKYPKPFNLKKKQINYVIEGQKDKFDMDFVFEDYISSYCKKLTFTQLLITQEVKKLDEYEFSSRVKQPQSRLSKLLTYRFEKQEQGKSPINKCLNDLFGCRIILTYDDIEATYDIIDSEVKEITNVKVTKKNNDDYEAIHIYCKGLDNTYFPWEIQIWHSDKVESNKISHERHKQSYLEWSEIMNN